MGKTSFYAAVLLLLISCGQMDPFSTGADSDDSSASSPAAEIGVEKVAEILSLLPLDNNHLREVHDAVSGSSSNGYDEEYMMRDIFNAPGSGVGGSGTRASYDRPLRELFTEYFENMHATKASAADPNEIIDALCSSDMQIYWPYSDYWDGKTFPIITFDPGYGAESNIGYEISCDENGNMSAYQVIVDESIAQKRPVWVINANDDSGYVPLKKLPSRGSASSFSQQAMPEGGCATRASKYRMLTLDSVVMRRNYDSWFAGASEFFFKCGNVEGFSASTEAEMRLYQPTITDFMFVVKRSQVGAEVPLDCVVMADYSNQLDKLALMITEDDGGTRTSWKTECTVKLQSKSYGFVVELPFNSRDDIVWRGQVPAEYFQREDQVSGIFGDLILKFTLE